MLLLTLCAASRTALADAPPTISQPAFASPAPVTGKSAALAVLAADDGGELALIYKWRAASGPALVVFGSNGSNAAKSSTATFSKAGSYLLEVTATDALGQRASSSLAVNVVAGVARVSVQPASAVLQPGGTVRFSAFGSDQFGAAVASLPPVRWSAAGGTVDPSGGYTAGPNPGGPYLVTAEIGTTSGTALVTVSPEPGSPAPLDAAPPEVWLISPLEEGPWRGSLTFAAGASDDLGVLEVAFFVDGREVGSAASPPYALEVDALAFDSGPHLVVAEALDFAGRLSRSRAVAIVIDNTPATGCSSAPSASLPWLAAIGVLPLLRTRLRRASGTPR